MGGDDSALKAGSASPHVEVDGGDEDGADGDGLPNADSSACEVYWGQTPVDSKQLLDLGQKKLEKLIADIGGVQNITEDNFPEVHIRGDVNTPYQCIGGVIYTMQYAGFQKIGFISEPVAGSGTLGRL